MKTIALIFIILIINLPACSSSREFIPKAIINQWFRSEEINGATNVYLLEFEDDGNFKLLLNETESDGSYYVKGNQLVVRGEACEGLPGTYDFKITVAGSLRISINEDFCSLRIQHFIGKWFKKK